MEDSRIIDLFWQRSEQAIDAVAGKYGPMCHSIAWNLLRSEQDAQECVNDTWYALWQAIPPQRPNPLAAFVAKIARNLAIKRLGYHHAQKRTAMVVSFEELNDCIPALQTQEEILEGKELSRLLDAFLDTLDPEDRNMFLRRYWFFDSIGQIAAGFGMSQSKVKMRLYRIRNRLKDYLFKEAEIHVG